MREEVKPVKLPSAKLLVALVVFTLLSSTTMATLNSFPINVVQASPAENARTRIRVLKFTRASSAYR
jgi:hypothetical protein